MKRFRFVAALAAALLVFAVVVVRWKGSPPASVTRVETQVTTQGTASATPSSIPARTNPGSVVAKSRAAEPADLRPKLAPALDDFADWVKRLEAGEPADLSEGERLALNRRNVMLHLIKTDPEKALASAVPAGWRSELPASITQHFEQRVDARGAFDVLVATDFERNQSEVSRQVRIGEQTYHAYVYGWRKGEMSQSSIPVHGIAIGGHLALDKNPIRILSQDEVKAAGINSSEAICGVSGQPADSRRQPVAADAGGHVRHFCGIDHFQLVNEQWLAAEGGGGGIGGKAVTRDQWNQGAKNVLYMRVNFPDDQSEPISEAGAYNAMSGVNTFYIEGSYNTTAMIPTVTPLLTLPQSKSYYGAAGAGELLSDARQLAREAGYDTDNYDRDIVAHPSVPGFDWGGLASVGGKGVWLQSTGVGVTSHELGHNQGLWHANSWDVSANSSIIGPGTHVEYGNVYDTMGQASAGANQFNAMHKWRIDWLPEAYIHDITTNGVYRLFAFDVPTRTNGHFFAAKVRKDWQRDYWIEFRQRFPANPWLVNGVMLNWDPWLDSSGGTHLLDTTPGTPTLQASKEDAALTIGRTFTDPAAGVHITPVARGGSGINSWMDVNINLGSFPSNRPPTLQISCDQTNVPAGTRINFAAVATDPETNALAYHWEFGDFTFSTNNAPTAFKTWTNSGERVVRCVVSDMKGGVASANLVVSIGAVTGVFRVSGRVTDTNGVPLEGVRVDNGATNRASYLGAYTDSNGYYTIANVASGDTFAAVKYGYIFSPDSTNVTVGPSAQGVDFIATPLTTLNIAMTTNTVSEPAGTADFIITRTGDTNSDLTVMLYQTGTATIGSDYNLPPLQSGTNFQTVTIPAGSNSLVLPLQVINDGTGEGPETVTLTLAEDPGYVLTALGEATMTILDNDTLALPSVSVTATTSSGDNSAPESGYDSGRFVFTRTGSVANDLTVFYSASGSATAGVDYQAMLGVVIIPAGQTSAVAEFQTIDDTLVETNETVIVAVSPNAAYSVSGSSTTIRIVDDDLVTVVITPTGGAAEPSTSGRFTVTRTGDLAPNLVVNYSVSGSASNGVDYAALSGTVTIPAGATTANITVTPIDDALLEGDESVIATLTSSAAYNIGTPGTARLFIADNEIPSVNITAADDEASEPGSDTGMITISRGSVTAGDLIVQLAITGSALSGEDYIPLDNFVTIPDGSSSVDILLTPFDDLHKEETETVIVSFVTNANYTFPSGARASVGILDDDNNSVPAVGFLLPSSGAPESRFGGVIVSLSTTSTAPVTVDYHVVGGTATGGGVDYSLPAGTLSFDPGELAQSLPITIVNDTLVESNETIRVVLSNPIGATHDGIKFHTYTILDDDGATVSVTNNVPVASEAGPVSGNFRISRTGGTTNSLAVLVQVTGTASAPADYGPIPSVITIPAGASFVDVPVTPADDATVEVSETVVLTLASAPGAKLSSSDQATVTILDNDLDTLPVITVVSTNNTAAEPGTDTGEFIVSRAGDTNAALAVFFTLGGTASNGVDYAFITNVVIIPAGQTSAVVTLTPIDDQLAEGEETAIFDLTVRDTYRVGSPAEAVVTILDNDQNVRVEISDAHAAEPGTDTGEFTFTRFGVTNTPLTVFFTVTGTASNGVDYVAITNSITIPTNEISATLLVTPVDDTLRESTETVIVTLQTNAAYSLGSPFTGTVMLFDDEPTVSLESTMTNASENGEQPGVLTIQRGGDPTVNLEVHLSISGTATFGVDYPAFRTNICMPANVMTAVITFYPTNELLLEGQETVFAALVPDAAYTILSPSNATVTIEDVTTNHFPVVLITSPIAKTIFAAGSTNLNLILEATASDPDDTNAVLTFEWSQVSGPDAMYFSDPATNNTTVSFTNAGVYLLRLAADDGQLRGFANLVVVVDATNVFAPDLLHWKFDDGSGTNALDSSGATRNGLVTGASWITNGAVGGALAFDGVSNVVQEISGTNFLDGLNALTVSLWVKTSATNDELGVFTANTSGATNATLGFGQVLFSSCLGVSNLLQATLPTTGGNLRYVSSRRFASNQWQHVALVWTNGTPLALYLNGEPDAPAANSPGVEGVLTNCPQFLVGRGLSTNYWNGAVDDVQLFARALDAGEVKALLSLPPTNFVPFVEAGSNVTVQLITPVGLAGVATDDGLPNPPATMSNVWLQVGGADTATISNSASLVTGVGFTNAGNYIFRLLADDTTAKVFDDVTVTVTEPTMVSIDVADPEAGELGPDEGMFSLSRSGDTNNDITVTYVISGTASNGADYVTITNVMLLPASLNSVTITIHPFLEGRTEGDETVTLTILPNLAYTIANLSATITIHDSPYGVWTVNHFTLEELTDPTLSGEGTDFDHDGLVNFVEYAFNREPKVAETNSPMAVAIEFNSGDNTNHITLTYQRRILPADVRYAVYISNDLLVWNTGPSFVEELQVTADPNGFTETVKSRIVAPYTPTTIQFLTIRVWRPAQP